uniref:Uncharacterized protein n=1 Tax=Romanomermis culicivorax TaxID=13658 RepID=A0A915KCI7_ROMCU
MEDNPNIGMAIINSAENEERKLAYLHNKVYERNKRGNRSPEQKRISALQVRHHLIFVLGTLLLPISRSESGHPNQQRAFDERRQSCVPMERHKKGSDDEESFLLLVYFCLPTQGWSLAGAQFAHPLERPKLLI